MIKRYSFIIFLLIAFVLKSFSQSRNERDPSFDGEIELPLTCNPVIKEYLKKNASPVPDNSSKFSTDPSPDTLQLPFIDDFSKPFSVFPDPHLWLDSGAFINTTYGDNPPTVGVATFDGIDKFGNPYDPFVTTQVHEPCDTLTSHCINMGGLTATDNVVFSFYYQPQGIGIAPYTDDSLVLEFLDSSKTWNEVWSHEGNVDSAFKRVNIAISDGKYFFPGFQFHFYNYAIPNGNRSHWNIDYVMLDKNRNLDESKDELSDVGFIYPPTSILNEFQSMPWPHYKPAPSSFMKSSYTQKVHSIRFGPQGLVARSAIYNSGGTGIFSFGPKATAITLNGDTSWTVNLSPFSYPTDGFDSATFLIKDYLDTTSTNLYNDSASFNQNFYNYYAYDDGSAESHYGLTTSGSIAYQYNIKKADSLQGLQIYFNPTGYPVHNESFEICYWTSLTANPYKTTNLTPMNIDSINGFVNYYFDTPQWVPAGTIYVGVIQDNTDPIGIGVDKNNVSNYPNSKVFYNIFNQWYTSSLQGYLMMRPLFGKSTKVGIEETVSLSFEFNVYPNPATQSAVISYQSSVNSPIKLKIVDITGREIYIQKLSTVNCQLSTVIDVSNFSDGVYFIQLTDEKTGAQSTQKLLIQH